MPKCPGCKQPMVPDIDGDPYCPPCDDKAENASLAPAESGLGMERIRDAQAFHAYRDE